MTQRTALKLTQVAAPSPAEPAVHTLKGELLHRAVRVALVGCGGNGSQMLTGLARLHVAMKALGHPAGLDVTTYDPDQVSVSNVGRQLFSPEDVGQYKAVILTHRVNCFFGLNWQAKPLLYGNGNCMVSGYPPDLLITCVDTVAARRAIYEGMRVTTSLSPHYWLDMGNSEQDGQVILGQPDRGPVYHDRGSKVIKQFPPSDRLPTWADLNPELLTGEVPEDNKPSCSLAEALQTQGLYINQHMATWALTLLERLFRYGKITHHGYWINLETGKVNPVPVPGVKEGRQAA